MKTKQSEYEYMHMKNLQPPCYWARLPVRIPGFRIKRYMETIITRQLSATKYIGILV